MVRFFKNPYENMVRRVEPRPDLPDNYQEWEQVELEIDFQNKPSEVLEIDMSYPRRVFGKCVGSVETTIDKFRGIYGCKSYVDKVIVPDIEITAYYLDNDDEEYSDIIEIPSQTVSIDARGEWEEGNFNPRVIELTYNLISEDYDFITMEWQGTY